jgi:hypothetical protein
MPTFDFPLIAWWGLPLVAAPLVIHLLNRLRLRRVRFAAVEFLLASQRKYRATVVLRQLLLLALRTAVLAALVLALAQPRWRHMPGGLFGSPAAPHAVLLDDSYSMQDRSSSVGGLGDTTAYQRGVGAVERILEGLADRGGAAVVLARLSELLAADPSGAERTADPTPSRGATLLHHPVTPGLGQRLREWLARNGPSSRADSPIAGLAAIGEHLGDVSGPGGVLWVVSDFRSHDWHQAAGVGQACGRLAEAGVELRLVDCAVGESGDATNLAIERLESIGGVPAVGVLVPMEVVVRNDGLSPARDVLITLHEDGEARPGVRIAAIPPGGSAAARFEARFANPGGHTVEARLPVDAVQADNARVAVIEVVERASVLVVDQGPRFGERHGDAFFVASALAPGEGALTGLAPRVELPRALATIDLAVFDSIWILDVERLDGPELSALETYARDGGGVVFFTGPRTQADTVNRLWHRDGAGVFPVPLAGPVEMPGRTGSDDTAPDVIAEEHPVVTVLAGQRNPLLDTVRVGRVMAVAREHPISGRGAIRSEDGVRRLLSLRGGAPLAIERPYGRGTVAVVLSTAAPEWNTWARGNPSWVVTLLELERHVAAGRRRSGGSMVGDALTVILDPSVDAAEVDFELPPDGTAVRTVAEPTPDGRLAARLPVTSFPGTYVASWDGLDGTPRRRATAVNVDPDEGRLERIDRERLAEMLAGARFTIQPADDVPLATEATGGSLVRPLLVALVIGLLAEQAVARLAGYHHPLASAVPTRRARGDRKTT